ncbi:MAG: VanW family protein [Candidatus Altimarinota bacterium]
MAEEILLLPAPRSHEPKKPSRKVHFGILSGLVILSVLGIQLVKPDQEILATIPLEQPSMVNSETILQDPQLEQKNQTLVNIVIDQKEYGKMRVSDLGIQFAVHNAPHEPLLFGRSQASAGQVMNVTLDYKVWNAFLQQLRSVFERPEIQPSYQWVPGNGWTRHDGQTAIRLETDSVERKLERVIALVQDGKKASIHFSTQEVRSFPLEQVKAFEEVSRALEQLIREPLQLQMGEETTVLDLNLEEDLILVSEESASINEEALKTWIDGFVAQHSRPASRVSIVGKEEIRAGVFKALIDGEFKEGVRIHADELLEQIITAYAGGERVIKVKTYEIPVKVYSELEQTEYELLSVGYSEYSTGNAPNRVHNVTTGLNRMNGILFEPGQTISFNKSVGSINGEFRIGYGIYGSVALPVLGGGICQVSTTFYRALLNLGVPITQRQNHSWDLSYYQSGGYGLDATIYPEKGLDVKAINDLNSHLFTYSYTRPDTQEAFVLIYGKGDGRKVTLTPEKEYVPFKGAKTLKWKQTVEMMDGEVREYEIVSRYRS